MSLDPKPATDYRGLRAKIAADHARRQEALRNGCAGMVPVCCRTCARPIATTSVDRAKNEPAILMDFPENISPNWECTDCFRRERAS